MIKFLLSALLCLSCARPAFASAECMARLKDSWISIQPQGLEISAASCSEALTYAQANPPQLYHLSSGPILTDDTVTCQWTWVPSGQLHLIPNADFPESIVCDLFI